MYRGLPAMLMLSLAACQTGRGLSGEGYEDTADAYEAGIQAGRTAASEDLLALIDALTARVEVLEEGASLRDAAIAALRRDLDGLDLSGFLTPEDLEDWLLRSEAAQFLTAADLSGLASEAWVQAQGYAADTDLVQVALRVDRHDARLDDHDRQLAALAADLSSLRADLGGLSDRLSGVEQGLASAVDALDTLDGTVAGLAEDLAALTGVVGSVSEDLATLTGAVGGLTDDLAGLTGTVGGLTDDLAGLTGTVGGLTDDLAGLTGTVGGLTGDLSSLSADLASLEGTVGTLSDGLATLTGTVGGLSSDLGSLSGTVQGLSGRLGSVETDVAALQTTVADLSDVVGGLLGGGLLSRGAELASQDGSAFDDGVLDVPGEAVGPAEALAMVSDRRLDPAGLLIRIAGGTWRLDGALTVEHPDAGWIRLEGAGAGRTVLRLPTGADGVVVGRGGLGRLDGMSIVGEGGRVGLRAGQGGVVRVGPDVVIAGFDTAGVMASQGASVWFEEGATSATVVGAGNGFVASDGGTITATGRTVDVSGFGAVATAGGRVLAEGLAVGPGAAGGARAAWAGLVLASGSQFDAESTCVDVGPAGLLDLSAGVCTVGDAGVALRVHPDGVLATEGAALP